MTIRIIPVAASDVEAISALARIIWHKAYANIIPAEQIAYMLAQRYDIQRLLAELETPGIWWDQALVDDQLSAFASTLQTELPGKVKLDKLYVAPERQSLGLGGQLIAHVSARAVAQGKEPRILAVNKRNERAIAAYNKHGFVVRDAVCVDIGNDFIMAKALRPA